MFLATARFFGLCEPEFIHRWRLLLPHIRQQYTTLALRLAPFNEAPDGGSGCLVALLFTMTVVAGLTTAAAAQFLTWHHVCSSPVVISRSFTPLCSVNRSRRYTRPQMQTDTHCFSKAAAGGHPTIYIHENASEDEGVDTAP